jgi:hypothetical protein
VSNRSAGYTVLETLVTMTIFVAILWGVYIIASQYGNATRTEHARMKLQQESRFMVTFFASEVKEAGSMIAIGRAFFKEQDPYFCGIYPLNNTQYPDGVILASGDHNAVTTLAQDFKAGDADIYLETLEVMAYDPTKPHEVKEWEEGDIGIVLNKDGYYIFYVSRVNTGDNSLTVRDTPVYFSGLLDTTNYKDNSSILGDTIVYEAGKGKQLTPVIRLANFSIYLFQTFAHPEIPDRTIRQFIRVTDTVGEADILGGAAINKGAQMHIMSEYVYDLQLSYRTFPNMETTTRSSPIDPLHYYFAPVSYGGSSDLYSLMSDIRQMQLKQVDISYVIISDELAGGGKTEYYVDNMGDVLPYNMPSGKYSAYMFTFSVEPRNFSNFL